MDCSTELPVFTSHAKIGFLKEKTVRSKAILQSFLRSLGVENQANDRLWFILLNIVNFESSKYSSCNGFLIIAYLARFKLRLVN